MKLKIGFHFYYSSTLSIVGINHSPRAEAFPIQRLPVRVAPICILCFLQIPVMFVRQVYNRYNHYGFGTDYMASTMGKYWSPCLTQKCVQLEFCPRN